MSATGPAPATFLGHPRGLATLFFTEMWERFTYYGMRAVLVLFLVAAVTQGGFGIDDKTATAIYGLYTAGVYLAALPGGWIADRLIGARRAVLIGGIGIALGNAILATSLSLRAFYLGLFVIVLGVGLLKPNVSAMVAELYPEGGARLDAGFTVFYMGINLGATLGPVITGGAQQLIGPRAGFAAAGLFMALGVIQYHFTQHHLGDAGKPPRLTSAARTQSWIYLWVGLAASLLTLAACTLGWIDVDPLRLAHVSTLVIAGTAMAFFAYVFLAAGLSADRGHRGAVSGQRAVLVGVRAGWILPESLRRAVYGPCHRPFRDSRRLVPVAQPGIRHHVRAGRRMGVGCARAAPPQSFRAGKVRHRRHPHGHGIPGDVRGLVDRRPWIEGSALLADPHVSVPHLRRAVPESGGAELHDQTGAEASRGTDDGDVVPVTVARQSRGRADRRRIRREQRGGHAGPIPAHRVLRGGAGRGAVDFEPAGQAAHGQNRMSGAAPGGYGLSRATQR
jgi:MFS family permease